MRTRLTIAQQYAYATIRTAQISMPHRHRLTEPPTSNKKTRDNLSIISRELREEDSNLRPPGYEPGKLTSCSTPRCIFTLNGVSLFCECKGMAKKRNFQISHENNSKFVPNSIIAIAVENKKPQLLTFNF